MSKRAFVIPYGLYQNKKTSTTKMVLVNTKRFMPDKLKEYEGTVGLFGVAQNPNETPLQTVIREITEEIPTLESVVIERIDYPNNLNFLLELNDYSFFAIL